MKNFNLFQFLKKKYSRILMAMFLFAIIFITFFYLQLYRKIMFSENNDIQEVNEVDKAKLDSIIKKIKEGEKRYTDSFKKQYRDIF